MKRLLFAAFVAAVAHLGVWVLIAETVVPPDVGASESGLPGLPGPVASLSFSPFQPGVDPTDDGAVTKAELDRDLTLLEPVTGKVRLYASRGGLDLVPEAARAHGLSVSAAAWLSGNPEEDRAEIERAVDLARDNWNVRALYVGNEALLRKDLTAEDLIAYLREVRDRVSVPVTTGEVWHTWLEHPELAREVDFIAAHMLPYWEGVPADQAVKTAFERYDQLRAAFPGKKVVIAEFGWPSQGYNNKAADTGPEVQAEVIRDFLLEARTRNVEYNIIEAFDQPWKTNEGSVGAYWGLFDAARHPKFALTGPVTTDHDHTAAIGLVLGVLLTWLGLRRRNPTLPHALLYALAANGFAAGIAIAAVYPIGAYMTVGTTIMWGLGLLMVLPLAVMTLAKVNEIGEVLLGRGPARLLPPAVTPPADWRAPFVSVHVPAYKEEPEMLARTLDSVAGQDYPAFECLVILNNTTDPAYWRPVAAHCAHLNQRLGREAFKFVYLPRVAGFKAGAMNTALAFMDPGAEVIAVIDADYVVDPGWLRDLVPAFADPELALVQAPQDHRDGQESLLKTMMNWEYAGFFDIGMVQRNEDNAIIAHGTMLLIRRDAFEAVGGWSTATIVEDTDLGLRLFQAGWSATYTNRRYGRGLLPDTFKAFKTQRHRWAYGAVQLIKSHWRHMLPRSRTMTPHQKEQFVTGWFFWLSDALGVAIALLNLIWVPVIVLVGMTLPMMALTVPILTAFAVNVLHCVLLYRKRVGAAIPEILGAAVASMSLQYAVADAVLTGFIKDNLPFARTDKGGNKGAAGAARRGWRPWDSPVFREAMLGIALLAAAAVLVMTNQFHITEQNVFAATVAVQSLPFLAACFMRLVEVQPRPWRFLRRTMRAQPLRPLTLLLVAAGVALAVGLATAQAAPAAADGQAPSVAVDCDTADSDDALLTCARRDLAAANRDLEDRAKRTLALLPATARPAFEAAQGAWRAYRDADCAWNALDPESGTVSDLIRVTCQADLTAARVDELSAGLGE
jgi:exo-beta-1,3-glucanase (GH17 family)/cellulose synthase/poly-beta-1,6-N-acetylglucosamine synthase-like glycosyltransferase/uncharacterized protein YecT (DUF1311 family)